MVIVLLLASSLYLLPVFTSVPSWWPSVLPREPLRLGLDLQGGIHLILQVEGEKAVETALNGTTEDLKRELTENQITTSKLDRVGKRIHLQLRDASKSSALSDLLKNQFPVLVAASDRRRSRGTPYWVSTTGKNGESASSPSTSRSRRFATASISSAFVSRSSSAAARMAFSFQLPGIQDPQRAKDLIGKTAVLEFKLVAAGADPTKPSSGTEVLPGEERDPVTGQMNSKVSYTLERKTLMTGEVIADARVRPSTQMEGPYVELVLNSRGAKLFEQLTAANVNRQLAIVLDGKVKSAPSSASASAADERRSPATSTSARHATSRSSCAPARYQRL
jgi:preprotein translocase subunit SecD